MWATSRKSVIARYVPEVLYWKGLKETKHRAMLTPHHILLLETTQIAGATPLILRGCDRQRAPEASPRRHQGLPPESVRGFRL
jgi:hypothetical protein